MPIYKYVNKDFFKKWTPEMAYVLGFFAADGYITVNRRGGQFWSIQITDKILLYKIRKVINSEHKVSKRQGGVNEKTQYRLQIGNIEMCHDLRKLGFSERKTKSMSIPNIPSRYFTDFTRGYFDGDGNVWVGWIHKDQKTPSLTLKTMFTSCSGIFLRRLLVELTRFGLTGGSIYQSKGNYYRLQFSAKDSMKLYNFMYNHSTQEGLFLSRKKITFERFKSLRL